MNTTRTLSTAGAGVVATIAAWSSWSHMVHVALRYGERPEVAYVLPLSVDGLLVVASAAMVDDRHAGRKPRTSAKVAFAIGVAASLAANIDGAHPNLGARIVAGWPALALLLVVELLSRRGRRNAEDQQQPAVEAAATAERPEDAPVRSRAPRASGKRVDNATRVAKAVARTPDASDVDLASRLKLSQRTVQRHLSRLPKYEDPTPVAHVNGNAVMADAE